MKPLFASVLGLLLTALPSRAATFHVSTDGNDTHPGKRDLPFRTIQHAAKLAQPGDVITVHEGVYRERINPPRGGLSDDRRIIYQAAAGERVVITGSEPARGWQPVQDNVWKLTLPSGFFGEFNPYTNVIRGDWFNGRGRVHHTGAVYLNGDWLTEAASLEEVLLPEGQKPAWLSAGEAEYLLNVAWLRPVTTPAAAKVAAAAFDSQSGVQTAPCSEGGECIGWIEHGDWTRYAGVDFGTGTETLEIRTASATAGGIIEVRLDEPGGRLLGACPVGATGDWQAWTTVITPIEKTRGKRTLCLVFKRPEAGTTRNPSLNPQLWFARVNGDQTTIWAQFDGVNPNEQEVEINARQTVFYPAQPGRNYLTVRGFTLQHAATPWAPPTAEQIGLIGTHWSRGWIIEHNTITHSVCSGIALGKHGDEFDNTSADTAEGYVKTIERAHAFTIPWTKANIGHHIVRHNTIAHCEQAGIVGSLGAAFSMVEDNDIHDIHVRRLFTGAEMAGIKFHAAIDTIIRHNHIHHTTRGLWLDWMAQGTSVSANLFHHNASEDLFVEVNHGPFLVDNNLFLSSSSLLDMSEGGAYVHNLFAGRITNRPEPSRETPYHPAHSTTVAGLAVTTGGDNRFLNNLFVGDGTAPSAAEMGDLKALRWISSRGLWGYDGRAFPILAAGNVYYRGALPSITEADALVLADHDPAWLLREENGTFHLQFDPGNILRTADTALVATERLGKARVPDLPYVDPEDHPIRVDTDYFGHRRDHAHPTAGPFERVEISASGLRVW